MRELKDSYQEKLEEQRKNKEEFEESIQNMQRNNIKV
jgi:hypothetical protein